MVTTYDPACYDLAEHFLQDEPCRHEPELYKKHADDLAKHIQNAVEDWFIQPPEWTDGEPEKATAKID